MVNNQAIYKDMLKKQYELNNELVQINKELREISMSIKDMLVENSQEIRTNNLMISKNNEEIKATNAALNKLESIWLKVILVLVFTLSVLSIGKDAFEFFK